MRISRELVVEHGWRMGVGRRVLARSWNWFAERRHVGIPPMEMSSVARLIQLWHPSEIVEAVSYGISKRTASSSLPCPHYRPFCMEFHLHLPFSSVDISPCACTLLRCSSTLVRWSPPDSFPNAPSNAFPITFHLMFRLLQIAHDCLTDNLILIILRMLLLEVAITLGSLLFELGLPCSIRCYYAAKRSDAYAERCFCSAHG